MKQWVTFEVNGQLYVADSEPVQRVIKVDSVTRLPGAPPHVVGVTPLQGDTLPVIDTGLALDQESCWDRSKALQAVVVETPAGRAALLVDGVTDVEADDGGKVLPSPVKCDVVAGFVLKGGAAVPVVDLAKLISGTLGGGA